MQGEKDGLILPSKLRQRCGENATEAFLITG
jgi:hypothetical protein